MANWRITSQVGTQLGTGGETGTSIPSVTTFLAGEYNDDGTFTPTMYWDPTTRTKMMLDWGCFAPTDTSNWSGVIVWIKASDGNGGFYYSQATGLNDITGFKDYIDPTNSQAEKFIENTLVFGQDIIPSVSQQWTFIAVSYDANKNPNKDTFGNFIGPTVTLQTLPKNSGAEFAPNVTNLTSTFAYKQNTQGQQTGVISTTWSPPTDDGWGGVILYMGRGGTPTGFCDGDALPPNHVQLSGVLHGTTFDYILPDPPSSNQTVTIFAVSVDRLNNRNCYVPSTTPNTTVTLSPVPVGSSGQEYASVVTSLNVAVTYPATADGTYNAQIRADFTAPVDGKWGGAQLVMSGLWTFTVASSILTVQSTTNPFANGQVVYVSTSGTLPAPLVANTPYYVVSATSTGLQLALTKGGGAITLTSSGTGTQSITTFNVLATVSSSPAIASIPAPNFVQTATIYVVSEDVNGKINSIVAAVTPSAVIAVGSGAGKLQLSQSDNSTFDTSTFIISSNRLSLLQVNGNLIVSGSISTGALDTNGINVGGGGGKPGQFRVYNSGGVQIGFIGYDGTNSGLWAQSAAIGGTGFANAPIKADNSGNVTITGASFTLNLTGVTTTINNAIPTGASDAAGLSVADTSGSVKRYAHVFPGYATFGDSSFGDCIYIGEIAGVPNVVLTTVGGSGSFVIKPSSGSNVFTVDGSGNLSISGNFKMAANGSTQKLCINDSGGSSVSVPATFTHWWLAYDQNGTLLGKVPIF